MKYLCRILTVYLVLDHDRVDEAYKSFQTVRAENSDSTTHHDDDVRAEFTLLQGQILHERLNAVTFMDLFRQPSLRKRCLIGWLTMFGAQGTATLVINSTFLSSM